MILRRELVFSSCAGSGPERLAAVVADLCRREGLNDAETAGVLAVALTWPPRTPRDPTALLRSFSMAA